tara:strand:- start:39 stop:473 length:435 start_codon:yes stop_codon:yes gene_type:complete
MSTLVTNTITGLSTAANITIGSTPVVSASANSLTIRGEGSAQTSIQQGLAKAWVNFNGASFATNDSFNVGSMTDHAAGTYTVTYSTNFGNANNSPITGAGGDGYADRLLTIDSITTSTVKMVENVTDNTQDVGIGTVHTLGDLA